jgi:NAD(P)H-hydrate epimerase
LLLSDAAELRGDAAEMFTKLPVKPVTVRSADELKGEGAQRVLAADILIDAVLGAGFRPPVSGLYAAAIAEMNESRAHTVAVDIPSGADADVMGGQTGAVARADAIVTFTAPRPAHVFGNLTSGPVVVSPIGSPEQAIRSELHLNVTTATEIAPLLARRPPDSHKGKFGHVLVIGGSVGKAGAAAMAGMAALKAGAGLSTVATAKSALPTVAGFHPEMMTEPLGETEAGSISMSALDYSRVDGLVEGKTVLAIGPGISRHADTAQFVRAVVQKYKMAMVVDADGLNSFEGRAEQLNGAGRTLVITPHPGEMARLAGLGTAQVQHDRLNVARNFAREHDVIVVLKGRRTLIARPDGEVWVNTTGNPGMASGGTGDILTGMVAGFVAQFPDRAMDAVCAAVYLHGLSGDVASEAVGQQCLVATDLLKFLPEAMRRVRNGDTSAAAIAGGT